MSCAPGRAFLARANRDLLQSSLVVLGTTALGLWLLSVQELYLARVSAIRGVGVDGVMRTLLTRGLVHEVGSDPDSGGGLYATTPLFLERLGLESLADLPELAPFLLWRAER